VPINDRHLTSYYRLEYLESAGYGTGIYVIGYHHCNTVKR